LQLAALADVDRQHQDAFRHRLDAQLEPALAAVREVELGLEELRLALLHAALQHREHRRVLDAREALEHRAPDQLGPGVCGVRGCGAIHVQVAPLVADDHQPFLHQVEHMHAAPSGL
jgi:hypothetical protein